MLWKIPVIINGIMAISSFMGGVLQVIDMTLIGVIWFPFLKLVDRANLNQVKMSEPETA